MLFRISPKLVCLNHLGVYYDIVPYNLLYLPFNMTTMGHVYSQKFQYLWNEYLQIF